jgi:hypothetical protein
MQSKTITLPAEVEVQATGCLGASSYRAWAEKHGFPYLEVLNWCSSAGDWQFLVSPDGRYWQVLFQENNYPRPGFSHSLGDEVFEGTAEEALAAFSEF